MVMRTDSQVLDLRVQTIEAAGEWVGQSEQGEPVTALRRRYAGCWNWVPGEWRSMDWCLAWALTMGWAGLPAASAICPSPTASARVGRNRCRWRGAAGLPVAVTGLNWCRFVVWDKTPRCGSAFSLASSLTTACLSRRHPFRASTSRGIGLRMPVAGTRPGPSDPTQETRQGRRLAPTAP